MFIPLVFCFRRCMLYRQAQTLQYVLLVAYKVFIVSLYATVARHEKKKVTNGRMMPFFKLPNTAARPAPKLVHQRY